ncbi:TPA: hypothetical protein N0F65_007953 [Lagenidium giganteum]|uniref:Uncharacterized protein n=1 Tax=Lagenidium giganteum TaxID=4803 RepID=A0AAV2YHI0_9STRA|nr:TPA: hypothetical protein N0F65_007953 [Lagenidium giganteum]
MLRQCHSPSNYQMERILHLQTVLTWARYQATIFRDHDRQFTQNDSHICW